MKLLFISHDASRTGAPMVLLHLIKWLKQNREVSFDIILIKGGPLKSEFEALGKVHVLQTKDVGLQQRIANKIGSLSNPEYRVDAFFKQFASKNYDLIYGNTVIAARYIKKIKQYVSAKTLMHVHELENVIKEECGEQFKTDLQYIDHCIACSKVVKDNLEQNHQIKDIYLIHEFVPAHTALTIEKAALKAQLQIAQDTLVIGGSGTTTWRKGTDYFLQVAKKVCATNDNVVFFWQGGDEKSLTWKQFLFDIENMGLNKRVIFSSNKPNPLDYFNMFDLFLMTSREDPFPLVCIENALLKNPVICFDKGVGSAEFVDNQVPYLDVDAMSHAIQTYLDHPKKIEEDGQQLCDRAQEYTVEKSGQKLFSYLEEILTK